MLVVVLAGAGIIASLILVGPILLDRMLLSVDFDPMPFDSALWKATPSEYSLKSIRLRMADDLLTKPVVGTTRQEIVAKLGEPDQTPYFREYSMVYHLGQERNPLGVDSEWLVIRLDDAGIATECLIVRD